MKKIIFYLVIFILTPLTLFSQQNSAGLNWSDESRLTSGFDDSNPKFGNRVYPTVYAFANEFLVFERIESPSVTILNHDLCNDNEKEASKKR